MYHIYKFLHDIELKLPVSIQQQLQCLQLAGLPY